MAQVNVSIHGKTYGISCDDGQEQRVQQLAAYVDARLREIAGAGAASTEPHLLVLTALVLADEIYENRASMAISAQNTVNSGEDDGLSEDDERVIVDAINHLASRIDSVAERLQKI